MIRLSPLCILVSMLSVIGYEFFSKTNILVFIAGVSLVLFLFLQRQYINKVGKLLIVLALLSSVLLIWIADPLFTLQKAVSRAAFFAAFLTALAFIRLAAQRSYIVQRCGQLVVNQPPAKRYGIISAASYLFGNVLNFGVIHLLGTMMERGNTLEAAGGIQKVQDTRRKRMSLALLRGFALLPLASPFSIALTLMLANMPQLQWGPLILMGTVAAVILFVIGWLMDHLQNPPPAVTNSSALTANSSTPVNTSWKHLYPFLAIILGVFLLSVSIEYFAEVSLSVAIIAVFPATGLIWFLTEQHYQNKDNAFKLLSHDFPYVINELRSEVAIISSACFFGVIMTDVIPQETIMGLLETWALSEVMLALLLCFIVASVAQFGISPFISATFLASSLAPLLAGKYSPEMLALGVMSGWTLAISASPVSISTLIMSAVNGQDPQTIAHRWNGIYSLISLAVMSLWIVILPYFL